MDDYVEEVLELLDIAYEESDQDEYLDECSEV